MDLWKVLNFPVFRFNNFESCPSLDPNRGALPPNAPMATGLTDMLVCL